MRLNYNLEAFELLHLIQSALRSDEILYLVGGAVRDVLLGRKLHDFDFVMPVNPTFFAKRLARRLNAGFFVLDDERHTARVVHHLADGEFFPLDFVQFTGQDLLADLTNRDFTINAMAVSVNDLTAIINPLDGQADLVARQIRLCTDRSLLDDPVRVLRGIRLALQFDFDFAEGLLPMLNEGAKYLPHTSLERQRDEFFKILEGPSPLWACSIAAKSGCLKL
jgi:tRNA nucleotidyltransferase/poly(A) polymerase